MVDKPGRFSMRAGVVAVLPLQQPQSLGVLLLDAELIFHPQVLK